MYRETIIICVYDPCERRDRAALSDNRISCCFFVFVIWRRRDAQRSRNEQKTRKTCAPTPTVSVLSARSVNHFRKKKHNASCTAAFYCILYCICFLTAGGDNAFGRLGKCAFESLGVHCILPISITDRQISPDRGLRRTGANTRNGRQKKKHGLMNYLIIAACDPIVGRIFIDGKLIFFFPFPRWRLNMGRTPMYLKVAASVYGGSNFFPNTRLFYLTSNNGFSAWYTSLLLYLNNTYIRLNPGIQLIAIFFFSLISIWNIDLYINYNMITYYDYASLQYYFTIILWWKITMTIQKIKSVT